MKKKIIPTVVFLFISVNAFADMSDCVSATKAENWNKAIEYCKPLSDSNREALGFLFTAYSVEEEGEKAQQTAQRYIDKYKKEINTSKDKESYAGYVTGLGNLYYFKDNYGATRNIKKGLEYITKGAQLGNFYLAEGEYPSQNMAISYNWFETASINGSQKANMSYILTHLNDMKEEAGYCLAMGQQLVAESYINGEAGLPKDDNRAKKYLIQAIELYKEAKKPSEDELKYCPPQKGLDLASAEKLLDSL